MLTVMTRNFILWQCKSQQKQRVEDTPNLLKNSVI